MSRESPQHVTYINQTTLHFPWNWCLRKIGQPAGLRASYAGSILINNTPLQTPQLAGISPPSTFTKGYPLLQSRKTFSRFEVMTPWKMKASEILYSHKFNLFLSYFWPFSMPPKAGDSFHFSCALYRISYLFLYFLPEILVAFYFIFIKK